MRSGIRAATALFAVLISCSSFLSARANSGESSGLSHVTLNATVDCKGYAGPSSRPLQLFLYDGIVTGRRYYPDVIAQPQGPDRVRISFDAPDGYYEASASIEPDDPKTGGCDWSGQLVLLPGGSASRDVTFKSNEAYLWDFGDVAAGLVADSATVTAVQVPSAARCGEKLAMDLETLSPPRTGSYFTYVSASMKDRTGLLVSDKGRRFYVALPTPRRSLLLQGAYIRLDISHQDLARWRAADRTLECDATSTQYGTIVPAPASNLQHVTVTAIAACTERNDLYERETPEVEVEDQLHRGRFFEPLTHELQRSGNVIDLVIDVPPGAYELGVGFPRIAGTALGCVSSLRFAVVAGKRRHLTTTIHSWGLGGSGRGFLVATFQAQSIRVGILMLSREIPCYGNREQFVAALARDTPEDIDYAVSDGDSFYGTYFPYDPALQPVMVIDGPGITKAYVALPVRRQPHPLESLTVLKVTDRQLGRWFDGSNSNRLICDESLSQNRP